MRHGQAEPSGVPRSVAGCDGDDVWAGGEEVGSAVRARRDEDGDAVSMKDVEGSEQQAGEDVQRTRPTNANGQRHGVNVRQRTEISG